MTNAPLIVFLLFGAAWAAAAKGWDIPQMIFGAVVGNMADGTILEQPLTMLANLAQSLINGIIGLFTGGGGAPTPSPANPLPAGAGGAVSGAVSGQAPAGLVDILHFAHTTGLALGIVG